MGAFSAFRDPGWNTYNPDRPRALPFDVTTAIVTYLAVVLVAAVLMVVVGTRGRERWTTFFRLLLSLHTGVVIIYCIVGNNWQASVVSSHTQYSTEVPEGIYAQIGLQIGLKSLNITLTANNSVSPGAGQINYNEMFSFNHVRDIRENYHEALERGLPFPIVYTLEYFSVDAGGLRWHRGVRTGGHFAYILLWTSLLSWCIANVLLCFAPSRGLFMLTLTGILMVCAVIVYHAIQPAMLLTIPFEDGVIRLCYGWSFWLCFAAGLLASVAGISLLCLHAKFPLATNSIFLMDYSQLMERAEGGTRFDYSPGPLKIDTPFSRRMNRILFVGGGEKSSSTLSLSSSIGAGGVMSINLDTSGSPTATASAAVVGTSKSATIDIAAGLLNDAFVMDDHATSTYRKTPDVDSDINSPLPPSVSSRVSSFSTTTSDGYYDAIPILFARRETTQEDDDGNQTMSRDSLVGDHVTTVIIEPPPRDVQLDDDDDDDDDSNDNDRLDRQTLDGSKPSYFRHQRKHLKRHDHQRLPHGRFQTSAVDANDAGSIVERPIGSHQTVPNLTALGEDLVETIC